MGSSDFVLLIEWWYPKRGSVTEEGATVADEDKAFVYQSIDIELKKTGGQFCNTSENVCHAPKLKGQGVNPLSLTLERVVVFQGGDVVYACDGVWMGPYGIFMRSNGVNITVLSEGDSFKLSRNSIRFPWPTPTPNPIESIPFLDHTRDGFTLLGPAIDKESKEVTEFLSKIESVKDVRWAHKREPHIRATNLELYVTTHDEKKLMLEVSVGDLVFTEINVCSHLKTMGLEMRNKLVSDMKRANEKRIYNIGSMA